MMAVSLWYCFYVLIFCTGNRLAYDFIAYMGFCRYLASFIFYFSFLWYDLYGGNYEEV